MYPPVCDHSPAGRRNVLYNINSYLVKKCGIPQKYVSDDYIGGGGEDGTFYKGAEVPYVEIFFTKKNPESFTGVIFP